jgi:hypothetical protein
MKLIVTVAELSYEGQTYLKGEPFEASEKWARALKYLKKAEDAPVIVAPNPLQTLQPRDMRAEALASPSAAPPAATAAELAAMTAPEVETPPTPPAKPAEARAPAQAPARRTYHRRDLKAEG